MIELKKTYRTRCGWKARVHATDMGDRMYPVLASILNPHEGWETIHFTAMGYRVNSEYPHDYDLIEVRPRIKLTFWVNLHRQNYSKNNYYLASYGTKEEAAEWRADNCLMTVPVTIEGEEGEGL